MYDQANHLRKLVLSGAVDRRGPDADGPLLIAVAGGKGGVGTTTLAVNLATALARDGRRALLIDADLSGADVSKLCGLHDGYTVADVLSGHRTLHETIQRGPAGVQVVPGSWASEDLSDVTPQAQQRFVRQLRGLGAHADYVIIDAGSGLNRVVQSFWRSADAVLLVTTPDLVSVMDAYASVKVHSESPDSCAVYTLVNFCADADAAADVHARLARACQRFLGFSIAAAGRLPDDSRVADAAARGRPFFLEFPDCAATRSLDEVAQRLIAVLTEHNRQRKAIQSSAPAQTVAVA